MRVILESPYAGNLVRNLEYARSAMRDSLMRGESPIASHLLYTQPGVLDDNNPDQRRFGIEAFWRWHEVADLMVVYYDLGISPGMTKSLTAWRATSKPVLYRLIGK